MLHQARNLLMDLDDRGRRPRFLVHDRDASFTPAFDAVLHGEGGRVIRTPFQAPNANAHVERWVGRVRRQCLDRLLIFSRRKLERRPLTPPTRGQPAGSAMTPRRNDLLGGLIHEYEAAAA